jgi:hypothetical protein
MPGIIDNPAIALYVATGVALVVMIGFFVYLWRLDSNVRSLHRALDRQEQNAPADVLSAAIENRSEPLRPQRIDKELSDGLNRS